MIRYIFPLCPLCRCSHILLSVALHSFTIVVFRFRFLFPLSIVLCICYFYYSERCAQLKMASPAINVVHREILLLGDSLTEQGYSNGWVSLLQDYFRRRVEVVNRGLGGYNTRWVLRLIEDEKTRPMLLPPARTGLPTETLFSVIFFGANDAVREGEAQHVPIAEYKKNLVKLIEYVESLVKPTLGVVVVTPPPVDECKWLKHTQAVYGKGDPDALSRTFDRTRDYRNAAMDAARSVSPAGRVLVVDLYSAFFGNDVHRADNASYQQPLDVTMWTEMFADGLHFDSRGGKIVFEAIRAAMDQSAAWRSALSIDCSGNGHEGLGMLLPHWSQIQP